MKLPPFEEFEKSITAEQREEWFSSANFNVRTDPPPTTNQLAEVAILAGYLSAKGMMAAYHAFARHNKFKVARLYRVLVERHRNFDGEFLGVFFEHKAHAHAGVRCDCAVCVQF